MKDDLEDRLRELEERLGRLERRLSEERAAEERQRRRASWLRIAMVIVVGAAYAYYLVQVTSVL